MNIKKIIKESLLREEQFHELNQEIQFNFHLHHDEYGHTQARKWRHGAGQKIYDYDIIKLLKDAQEEMVYGIIDGDIRSGRRFIVSRESGDYLNAVVQPEKISSTEWNLVIITVMKKQDFNISKGQLQVVVP